MIGTLIFSLAWGIVAQVVHDLSAVDSAPLGVWHKKAAFYILTAPVQVVKVAQSLLNRFLGSKLALWVSWFKS